MPYLGPKSFNTAPLTSFNLSLLNDPVSNNNNNNNNNNKNNTTTTAIDNTIINHHQAPPPLMKNDSSITLAPLELSEPGRDHDHNKNKNTLSTVASSNSICSNSTLRYNQSLISSETSLISIPESHSHKTIMGLNDEDNKTIIDFQSNSNNNTSNNNNNNNDSQLVIPPSPLKNYELVSISSASDFDDNEPVSLQPPLLRKKSGELIKSSLKLNTLSRSNSMPNAKTVRFATTLENIKFFKKSEKPNAVSNDNIDKNNDKLSCHSPKPHWDFDSSSSDDDDDDDENQSDISSINNDDNDDAYDKFLTESNSTSKWLIKSNDCPHNPFSLNFGKLASNNDVILESVKLNSSGNSLIGFVYAKNLSFKKKIIVRLTYDNWNSFIEIENSNYISSNHIFKYNDSSNSNSNNIYDKFSFIIKLDNLNTFSTYLNLEFCIQYIVNGTSYWDNNNHKNYKISLVKNLKNSLTLSSLSSSFDSIKLENKNNNNNNNNSLLFDIEDTNIKLKDNNNFKHDFFNSSKPSTDIKSLRTSNSFGLKKIKSESSIPTLKSTFTSPSSPSSPSTSNYQITNHGNKSHSHLLTNTLYAFTPSNTLQAPKIKKINSKSASASPSLNNSNSFELNTSSNYELPDYENIIKQFCFYTNPNINNNNNLSNDYIHLDRLNNELKSKTSMFVE